MSTPVSGNLVFPFSPQVYAKRLNELDRGGYVTKPRLDVALRQFSELPLATRKAIHIAAHVAGFINVTCLTYQLQKGPYDTDWP